MRGSVYYQSAVLTKTIFFEGAKKIDRINPIICITHVSHHLKLWRVTEVFGIIYLII